MPTLSLRLKTQPHQQRTTILVSAKHVQLEDFQRHHSKNAKTVLMDTPPQRLPLLLARAARLAGTSKENWDKNPRDVLVAPLVVFKTEWVKLTAKIVMPAGTRLQGKALSRAVNALVAGTTKGGVAPIRLGQSAAHVLQEHFLQRVSQFASSARLALVLDRQHHNVKAVPLVCTDRIRSILLGREFWKQLQKTSCATRSQVAKTLGAHQVAVAALQVSSLAQELQIALRVQLDTNQEARHHHATIAFLENFKTS